MESSWNKSKQNRAFSRREMIQKTSLGTAASILAPAALGWAQPGQATRGSGAAQSSAKITPDSLPKAWTREEIQRRWQAVRQQMKEANLDCLLVCQHHPGEMITERLDGDADVEYLTGISLPFK